MPYQVEDEGDMEEEEARISVVDVYDLASEIGKEFEKIIDRTGADAVTGLMPRVISALEHLEKLATRHENTSAYIQELRTTIAHLENEKIGKAEDRQRYERELEDIEDRLREESHELVAMVARLQDENRKLSSSLAKTEGTLIHSNGATPEVDLKVVKQLQEVIESQREQLHKTEKEAHLKTTELDNLKSQLEKVNHINRELRRRQRTSVSQMRSLIDERAELQAALQEEAREVAVLRQRLGLAQKENEDLVTYSTEAPDLTNKLVYDRDDPNRPRFTMTELKEILYERNELKARVSDLEDELQVFRPRSQRQEVGDEEDEEEELEDAPVQGPLPYEPDDAPWKKEESGIRKLLSRLTPHLNESLSPVAARSFRRLFGDEGMGGAPSTTSPGAAPPRPSTSPKKHLLGLTRP
ncbi:RILP-like protein homolog isoform X3 [Eriocheir sinensis]|uniref:RILP-like protein homolog isoform X3 n=1 Tax=Eriocheir sinensis TaxID=95602 RepID=UPI0021C8CF88|nr:RILP-like protein homolog isoform X3 [Eriocheir sinensis]